MASYLSEGAPEEERRRQSGGGVRSLFGGGSRAQERTTVEEDDLEEKAEFEEDEQLVGPHSQLFGENAPPGYYEYVKKVALREKAPRTNYRPPAYGKGVGKGRDGYGVDAADGAKKKGLRAFFRGDQDRHSKVPSSVYSEDESDERIVSNSDAFYTDRNKMRRPKKMHKVRNKQAGQLGNPEGYGEPKGFVASFIGALFGRRKLRMPPDAEAEEARFKERFDGDIGKAPEGEYQEDEEMEELRQVVQTTGGSRLRDIAEATERAFANIPRFRNAKGGGARRRRTSSTDSIGASPKGFYEDGVVSRKGELRFKPERKRDEKYGLGDGEYDSDAQRPRSYSDEDGGNRRGLIGKWTKGRKKRAHENVGGKEFLKEGKNGEFLGNAPAGYYDSDDEGGLGGKRRGGGRNELYSRREKAGPQMHGFRDGGKDGDFRGKVGRDGGFYGEERYGADRERTGGFFTGRRKAGGFGGAGEDQFYAYIRNRLASNEYDGDGDGLQSPFFVSGDAPDGLYGRREDKTAEKRGWCFKYGIVKRTCVLIFWIVVLNYFATVVILNEDYAWPQCFVLPEGWITLKRGTVLIGSSATPPCDVDHEIRRSNNWEPVPVCKSYTTYCNQDFVPASVDALLVCLLMFPVWVMNELLQVKYKKMLYDTHRKPGQDRQKEIRRQILDQKDATVLKERRGSWDALLNRWKENKKKAKAAKPNKRAFHSWQLNRMIFTTTYFKAREEGGKGSCEWLTKYCGPSYRRAYIMYLQSAIFFVIALIVVIPLMPDRVGDYIEFDSVFYLALLLLSPVIIESFFNLWCLLFVRWPDKRIKPKLLSPEEKRQRKIEMFTNGTGEGSTVAPLRRNNTLTEAERDERMNRPSKIKKVEELRRASKRRASVEAAEARRASKKRSSFLRMSTRRRSVAREEDEIEDLEAQQEQERQLEEKQEEAMGNLEQAAAAGGEVASAFREQTEARLRMLEAGVFGDGEVGLLNPNNESLVGIFLFFKDMDIRLGKLEMQLFNRTFSDKAEARFKRLEERLYKTQRVERSKKTGGFTVSDTADAYHERWDRDDNKARNVCLIIACHESCYTVSATNAFKRTLECALEIFPPEAIFVCDNGNSPSPVDNTEQVCKAICLEKTGEEGVNYLYVPEGNKTHVQYWVSELWIPLLVREGVCPDYEFAVVIDDDVPIPGDLNLQEAVDHLEQNDYVKAVGFGICAETEDGSRNVLVECQDLEYKISGLSKIIMDKYGSVNYCHGAIAMWRRDIMGEHVLSHHNTMFHGEDMYMGILLHKLGRNLKISWRANTLVPTYAPEDLLTLFNQRVRSWDIASHRKFLYFIRWLLFDCCGGWRKFIIKPFLVYGILIELRDWQIFFLLIASIHRDPYTLIWLIYQLGLIGIGLFVMGFFVMRHRPDLRPSFRVCMIWFFYKLMLEFVRIVALLENVVRYAPWVKNNFRIDYRKKHFDDIVPQPESTQGIDWNTVWQRKESVIKSDDFNFDEEDLRNMEEGESGESSEDEV